MLGFLRADWQVCSMWSREEKRLRNDHLNFLLLRETHEIKEEVQWKLKDSFSLEGKL